MLDFEHKHLYLNITGELISRPVHCATCASVLGTRSQEGKGGTARSLIYTRRSDRKCYFSLVGCSGYEPANYIGASVSSSILCFF